MVVKRDGDAGLVLHVGLGHAGLAGGAPQGGRLLAVDVAPFQEVQERGLGDAPGAVVDGGVDEAPIHGEAEALPEPLELLLHLAGEGEAGLDEGLTPDVAGADAGAVLGEDLGRQAVVVEAEGVEDLLALHAVVADHDVRVGVGVDVADVDAPGDGGRRGVHGVGRAGVLGVEAVDPAGVPAPLQLRLGGLEVVAPVKCGHAHSRRGSTHGGWTPPEERV